MEAITTMTCETCSAVVNRRSPTQRYCTNCSEARDLERKRLWARDHPPSPTVASAKAEVSERVAELAREAGRDTNAAAKMSIAWDGRSSPDLTWQVAIAMPFSYAASKNHIYAMRRSGHVALRRESRDLRNLIASRLRTALGNQKIAHNKLWLDILVQKPDHRGDAVNVVDLVCDAIKAAVPVDDRWFCLRRLDWEIAKENPRLFLKVGQETDVDSQVCSYCGQIRPFSEFNARRNNRLGIDRVCRICRREGRRRGKAERAATEILPANPHARPRRCLKCDKTFDSSGPGNRICPACQRVNARIAISDEELEAQRGQKYCNGEVLRTAS